jgi:uncharacterized protein (DUF2235 family)
MKRIVLCCDGTWNRADQEENGVPCPTNVVKLGYRVAKRDAQGVPQIVYYDTGVGTGNAVDRISGGAFGDGLEENIHDAYRFLACNYEEGDELFVFGFSRGAFTARSIVGMVRKCGILSLKHVKHYRDALALYRDAARPSDAGPSGFRKSYCCYGERDIKVQFIGVWDTVGALGIPLRGLRWLTRKDYQFHDTELSGIVQRACHALAIDERRGSFEPTAWSYAPKEWQKVEQAWFCGAHSDVGGGYAQHQLSDIPLQWMIGKAADAGLHFDADVMAANPLDPNPLGELHDSKTGFYNAAPDFHRAIGTARRDDKSSPHDDPTQSIHPSVLQRWDADESYRPKALLEYFRRIGDPRARASSEFNAGTHTTDAPGGG